MRWRLSSLQAALEHALESAGLDRGPWLVIAFGAGIAAWFGLPSPLLWCASMALALIAAVVAHYALANNGGYPRLRRALTIIPVLFALGIALVWARSAMVGQPALDRPAFTRIDGRIVDRLEQPAQDRTRLVLAMRDANGGGAYKVRINLPRDLDDPAFREGARVGLQARLMPPAPPMVPGGYNFARAAWFGGLAATGSAVGPVTLIEPATREAELAHVQRSLSAHVRTMVPGAAGSIAAAFASGDRGGIEEVDDAAMRDAGLTHLLSISGLHVSAVIGLAYILVLKILALWPWLALRVRLPLVAACAAALAGIGYTLLTGAQVPTVRSCIAALLVLGALALGREPLSLRMVAVAAFAVLLLWPESLVGPSFQMSFAAVIAIVALHGSAPVQAFLAAREESWFARSGRRLAMLLATGLTIELALMPIVLFHFHRAGVYGALANVFAIPLVTFITMPLEALALLLDIVGLGAPVWWVVGKSLDLLLGIAHFTAAQPGAVKLLPAMSGGVLACFVAGGLWLALWRGRVRLLGFIPAGAGVVAVLLQPVPDVLVTGDGRQVGVTTLDGRLLLLRDSRSDYTRDTLMELAGVRGDPVQLAEWPGARCSRDFCALSLDRGGRRWHLLLAYSRDRVEERALAAACERADIVVADRWLPRSCRPRWIKADRRMLGQTGGLSLNLENRSYHTVAQGQGQHGWWHPQPDPFQRKTARPAGQ